jgi:hypothetical protein
MHEHYAYWLEEKILQMTNYKDKGKEKKTISSFKSRNHFKAYYYQFITIGQAEGTSSPSTSMIDPWQRFRYSLLPASCRCQLGDGEHAETETGEIC